MADGSCEIDGCDEPATGPLCAMHRARKRRGTPMHQPKQERLPPRERHHANAIAYADAEEDEIGTAAASLDKAAHKHVLHAIQSAAATKRWKKASERQRKGIGRMLANARKRAIERLAARAKGTDERNCPPSETHVPAHEQFAAASAAPESVTSAAEDLAHGSREAVREGSQRESGRAAEVGEADPRAGAAALGDGAAPPGARHQEQGRADRGAVCGGGSRPSGPEAVRHRADRRRGKPAGKP